MKRDTPSFKKQLIILISLLLLIVLLVWFRQYPDAVERFYSDGFYRFICYIIRPVVNFLPFSIGDIFYTAVVLAFFIGIFNWFKSLFKKQFAAGAQLILRLFICLEIAWLWFYVLWGLNYYRPPAAQLLNLNDTTYTIKDVAGVANLIIDSANSLRACLDTADLHQSNSDIYRNALAAVNELGKTSPKFKPIFNRAKPSMYSFLLNYVGTSGYYNPFTAEAQLNYQMPIVDRPFVACHEMGHQTGWAREDEANFAGYAAGIKSPDKLLRYSAYYAGLEEFMRYLRRRDTTAHHALRLKISPLVRQDFKTDSAYWVKYQGPAEMISGIFFDKFLKANNQPHGMRTYNRMIRLTMGYYRRQLVAGSK